MAQHTRSRYQVSPRPEQEYEAQHGSLKQTIKVISIITHKMSSLILTFAEKHPYLVCFSFLSIEYFNYKGVVAVFAVMAAVLIFGSPIIKRYSSSVTVLQLSYIFNMGKYLYLLYFI